MEKKAENSIQKEYISEVECVNDSQASLADLRKTYLLSRHGTLDLDPLPHPDSTDPLNWPLWKKNINLALVSFHALMIGFMTGGPIAAFDDLANEFHVSLSAISYTVSLQIALLGIAPLIWAPLAERYGRRPVWLISTLVSMASNLGCGFAQSYGSLMTARAFQSIFNAPAGALGTAVVAELFFARERGFRMGIWTLMVTIGNPLGPLVMGFVATNLGWAWIFRIYAIINAVQFIGYFFLSPETKYVRESRRITSAVVQKKSFVQTYLSFGCVPGSKPLQVRDFYSCLGLLKRTSVFVPTLAHSVVFGFCSVLINVEIPALLGTKFGLNAQQTGLNFLGNVIGSLIGEQLSGPLSDYIRNRRTKARSEGRSSPEHRLWFSYPSYLLCIVGLVQFLVTLNNATAGSWTVVPIIGLAICAAGNQMQTTAMFTYAVDRNLQDSGGVGVNIIMVRQVWSFIGPFWFPSMFASCGLSGSAALCSGLIVVFAVLPVLAQQFYLGPRSNF